MRADQCPLLVGEAALGADQQHHGPGAHSRRECGQRLSAVRREQEAGRLRSEMEKRVSALEKRLDDQVDKLAKAVRLEVGDRGKAVEELEARTLQAARSARAEINGAIDRLQHEQSASDERARKALAELAVSLKAASAGAESALAAARQELRGEKLSRGDFAALLTELALRIKGEFELPTKK